MAFFSLSSIVLGLLDRLQILSQLYLIEFPRLLAGLGLLSLWHSIYPKLLKGSGMLLFFRNVSLMEFQVRYLAFFLLFSVIDSLEWLWMEGLHKNIQLMLEFPKTPLVLHFSYYTLMAFLRMLSGILLSLLMILLSILSVIRRLICSNCLNWLLNLNLTYERL